MGKEALKHTRQIGMSACQIEQYVKSENCRHDFSTVQHLLWKYLRSSGSSLEELSRGTGHSFFYLRQVMDGRRIPTREDILCLSFGMKLGLAEMEMLLKAAGCEPMNEVEIEKIRGNELEV